MPTRNVIKSVLHNFLGTYTSRYSDYEGYWLFGFIVGDLVGLDIDLLSRHFDRGASPQDLARYLAATRFTEQVDKSRLSSDLIVERAFVLNACLIQ